VVRIAGDILFGAMIVGGFAALIWSLRGYARRDAKARPLWRRAFAACGLILTSLQAILLAGFWVNNIRIGGWGNNYLLFRSWVRVEFGLFVLALPCLLIGSARYRWWALTSSVLLFSVCLFVALSM
jgi:hypothetical protein